MAETNVLDQPTDEVIDNIYSNPGADMDPAETRAELETEAAQKRRVRLRTL